MAAPDSTHWPPCQDTLPDTPYFVIAKLRGMRKGTNMMVCNEEIEGANDCRNPVSSVTPRRSSIPVPIDPSTSYDRFTKCVQVGIERVASVCRLPSQSEILQGTATFQRVAPLLPLMADIKRHRKSLKY